MREFMQVLRRFVMPYKKYVALSIIFNLLSALLNIFSFAALIPILQILFKTGDQVVVTSLMEWGDGDFKDVLINNIYYYICVVFEDAIDALDLEELGPKFEYAPYFPERINTEFVRIVDASSIRVRVYERGNKETLACGTGALAAVAAGVKTGRLPEGRDIKVRLPGGDLTVNYTDERMILTGSAVTVFEGEFEY